MSKSFFQYTICVVLLLAFASCRSRRYIYGEDDIYTHNNYNVNVNTNTNVYTPTSTDKHLARELYKETNSWIGVPYCYGGNDKRGVDCSGFVCQVFLKVYGKQLHRSSNDQYMKDIAYYINGNELQIGDLVFFATGKTKKVTHVGIYLGDCMFIHASSSKGVRIDDLRSSYYQRTWVAGGVVK